MLAEQFLDTWAIHNRILLYLLTEIPEEALAGVSASGGRSVGQMLAHVHNVRLMWLEASAPDLLATVSKIPAKKKDELSVIFIGRLHPVKNLDFLLRALQLVKGNVLLTIVGNAEDGGYVEQCKEIVKGFPPNIQVKFAGEIPNNQLGKIITQHHIFALPTQGENFGHAIFEALAAGKPVLISDQTPWRHLEKAKAGWDIPLQQPEQFTTALQNAVDLDQIGYEVLSRGAWQFVKEFVQQSELQTAYNNIFS